MNTESIEKITFEKYSKKISEIENRFRILSHNQPPYFAFIGCEEWLAIRRYPDGTDEVHFVDGHLEISDTHIYALTTFPNKIMMFPCQPEVKDVDEESTS